MSLCTGRELRHPVTCPSSQSYPGTASTGARQSDPRALLIKLL